MNSVCWPVCQKSAVPSGKDEEAVASIRWDGKKLNFVNESSSWVDFFGVVKITHLNVVKTIKSIGEWCVAIAD